MKCTVNVDKMRAVKFRKKINFTLMTGFHVLKPKLLSNIIVAIKCFTGFNVPYNHTNFPIILWVAAAQAKVACY